MVQGLDPGTGFLPPAAAVGGLSGLEINVGRWTRKPARTQHTRPSESDLICTWPNFDQLQMKGVGKDAKMILDMHAPLSGEPFCLKERWPAVQTILTTLQQHS